MRINYEAKQKKNGAIDYSVFVPTSEKSDDFVSVDTDSVYFTTTNVYYEVLSVSAQVSTMLPVSPTEGDTVPLFSLLYHSDLWWVMVGAVAPA